MNRQHTARAYRFTLLWTLVTLLLSHPARASLQQEMNQLFGAMSQVNSPGVYHSQRRGIITGGGASIRYPIRQEHLISVVPPSFEAGCGGIDLFAGSLSFVNADQFIQLLRSVAANAKGYAFQLALGTMCEKCSQQMETLQKKVQQLNQYFGQSCQLAQGVVNDALSAYGQKGLTDASLLSTLEGAGDVFTTWSSSDGKTPWETALDVSGGDAGKALGGNLVWSALISHQASDWFQFGDTLLAEAMMSVTGTVIVGPLSHAPGGGKSPTFSQLSGLKLSVADIIHGGDVTLYQCDTTGVHGCLSPTLKTVSVTGLATLITRVFSGSETQAGIISKMATNQGVITRQERALMTASPAGIGGMIRTLAALDATSARSFIHRAAPFMALHLSRDLLQSMLDAVRDSTVSSSHPYTRQLVIQIRDVQRQLNTEYAALQHYYGSEQSLIEHYQQVIQLIRKKRYYQQTTRTRTGS